MPLCLLGIFLLGSPITKADSLFAQASYIEAYEQYEKLLHTPMSTPRMLLRMAYTQEGVGHYPQALYHLLDYHATSYDHLAWLHALKLANQEKLDGYVLSDVTYLGLWLLRHRVYGNGLLVLLLVGVSVWCWLRSRRLVPLLTLGLTIGLFWMWQNFQQWVKPTAVVLQGNTALMRAPSPAAGVLQESLVPGTRVRVLEQGPVWTKIDYQNIIGYAKHITPITIR